MNISPEDFIFLQKFIKDESGIIIEQDKKYLLESRLVSIVEESKLDSFRELVSRVRASKYSEIAIKIIDAMTTNETSFFRDLNPFNSMKSHVIPEIVKKHEKEKTINIWSAACSTGQEAYSLAMLIHENFPFLLNWNLKIYASDISKRMIARGKEGCYSQLEINRGLPARMLVKYFRQNGHHWCIRDDVKKMVEFLIVNLVEAWPSMPQMDVIFLRHVLIYFNIESRKNILNKIKKVLNPGGYLILGVGETTLNIDDEFENVQIENTIWYRLKKK